MKKVMAERYQAMDGKLFDSPAAARQHEIDVFNAGVMVVEAQVTADNYESMPDFVRWLTDWIEYEE